MQFFRFLFLARSWAADKIYLGGQLDKIAKRVMKAGEPFYMLVYPEGTLVSKDTRPLSKKYADKTGLVE